MNKVTLYGLNKAGGFKLWSIETKDEEIHIEFGQENGKIQLKIESVKGKNIGRSNETTPAQQAELEALSKIEKQKDKGYRLNKDDLQDLDILPMLSADYTKQGHRIKYPCWGSDKMDGCRALAICEDGVITLKSRGGKLYDVKHLQGQLAAVMKDGEVWDGGAIFVVENTFADNQFNVVGGSHEQRKQWIAEKDSLIGELITVKYQALFKDTNIPQFPTFVAFRNYE